MSIIMKIISNPYKILGFLANKGMLKFLNDSIYLKILFHSQMNKGLNLDTPESFNEKLQWLKLHDRNPLYTSYVDKYEVREFIKKTIGKEYLVPLLGVYDEVEDVDFSILPDQFVLKPTHTSGNVIICRDKTKLDLIETKKTLIKWLKREYFWYQREWPYKNIKPRIICEELLVNETQEDLIDYKILCFNGEPKCLFLCTDRRSLSGLKVDFYDLNWNPLPFERHYPKSGKLIEKPECLEELLELSKTLSRGIPFVRVDFYIVNKQIKFGELTFYPGSGLEEFSPESFDYLLGSWIDLNLVGHMIGN